MNAQRTIPDYILEKILAHRPELRFLVRALDEMPETAAKQLARIYLAGESVLTAGEELLLASCQKTRPR
ncbi:MAG: hypothetical protein LC130_00155 [Bryobacterales bacterium]|nr:hypothetical protein [Bryobacterales bacterium]